MADYRAKAAAAKAAGKPLVLSRAEFCEASAMKSPGWMGAFLVRHPLVDGQPATIDDVPVWVDPA